MDQTKTHESPSISVARKIIAELKKHNISFEPRAYRITGMQPEAFKFMLDVENIRHTELKNSNYVLVSNQDALKCFNLDRRNSTKGCFLQEYNAGELQAIVNRHPGVTNKRMVAIKELPKSVAELLIQKLNRVKKGLLIETEETPKNRVNISIPDGLLTDTDRQKIAEAYLQTQLEITGLNLAARNGHNSTPTVENYENAVKEKRFMRSLFANLSDKLRSEAESVISSLNGYLTGIRQHLISALDEINNPTAQKNTGLLSEETKAIISEIPNGTYAYTADFIRKQNIHEHMAADAPSPEMQSQRARNEVSL